MPANNEYPTFYRPISLTGALNLYDSIPNPVFFAGGLSFLELSKTRNFNLISLANVDELYRIYRNDSFLEFGAMVKLAELYKLQGLPRLLKLCIEQIQPVYLWEHMTIGGLLANQDFCSDIKLVLLLLDAQIILKGKKSTRLRGFEKWLDLSKMTASFNNSKMLLLSKIRVSLTNNWNRVFYKKINFQTDWSQRALIYAGVYSLDKNLRFRDLRHILLFGKDKLWRNRNLELELQGGQAKELFASNSGIRRKFLKDWSKLELSEQQLQTLYSLFRQFLLD